jgi:hypothetical protein
MDLFFRCFIWFFHLADGDSPTDRMWMQMRWLMQRHQYKVQANELSGVDDVKGH